jgi:type I restriction enzyme M protein
MPEIVYKNPIDVITFKIFGIFDALRQNSKLDTIEDSIQIVLLLVSLYKDGIIDQNSITTISDVTDLKSLIHNSGLNSEIKETYLHIIEVLKPSLDILFFQPLDYLSFHLFQIEKEQLTANFSNIFDSLLHKLYDSQGRVYGQYLLPEEISRLMFNLANIKANTSVYNPFAGPASFGILLGINNYYVGQEISTNIQITGMLRLIAASSPITKKILASDSINNWNPTNEKFDVIISSPPFGMRLPFGISGKWGVIRNFENFAIEKGLNTLKKDGKLIIHVPDSFLFSSGQVANLRYHLIEDDLIESVISLPNNILHHTSIKTSILVINKAKKNKGFINFIIADEFVNSEKNRIEILQDVAFFNAISEGKETSFIKIVTNKEVKNNSRFLDCNRYFLEKIEGKKLIDFTERVRGERITSGELTKIVKIKDLCNDNLNFDLDVNSIESSVSNRPVFKIDESCLLLSKIGNTLKPTYFNYTNDSIYITDDIIALKVDLNIVDLEYLVNEFYTENVQKQLKAFFTGAVIPRIREVDLFSIKFNLPKIAEQKAKIQGVKEAFIQNKKNELAFQQELLGLKDESFREFASIKHTFRQYLNALQSNVAGTSKFIMKNEGQNITLDMIYSKNLNKTLGQHLMSLEGTIKSMSKLLSSFENEHHVEEIEKNDLFKLVTEAQNRFKNTDKFKFEKVHFDKDSFTMFDGTVLNAQVSISEDDFYMIFSNIISNAMDHGFKDETKKYNINTSISYNDKEKLCVLEISNNGAPMAKGFTLKHLITRGEKTTDSSGTGMGGADIKNILAKYGGTLDVLNLENELFPVTYIINIPYSFDYTFKF